MRALVALSLLALAACSSVPSAEFVTNAANGEAGYQELAIVSAQGIEQPHPHSVWIPGAYHYDAGRYIWVSGHWADPEPTALAR